MKVASLFDFTGNMLRPWLEAGYECHIYDIQHPQGETLREDGMVTHGIDLALPPNPDSYDFVSCFPPCTHVSLSGAAWFKGKGLRALQESIGYFATCIEFAEQCGAPYMIENPMSTISTYWRPPDHKFNPCDYSGYCASDDYTKETWIWSGNGFVMPPKERGGDLFSMPDATRIHHQAPGPERANIRSATPMGFARAAFHANSEKKRPDQ